MIRFPCLDFGPWIGGIRDIRKDMRTNIYYRRHTVLFVFSSLAVLVFGPGCSRTQGPAGGVGAAILARGVRDGSVVKSIDFVGNRKFSDNVLRKKVDFQVGDFLDPVLAELGRVAVGEYYRKKGYARAEVTLDGSDLAAGAIVYTVEEGPRIQIRSIKFTGNKAINRGDLERKIKTKTRDWFVFPVYYTEEKVAADVERLRTLYYQAGFLNHRVTVEGDSHITFVIDEGPIYKVGAIILLGNTKYDDETLLAGLELKPGRTYFERKAESQAKRIVKVYRENGYIDAYVEQRPVFREGGAAVVDVEFNVTEGRQFRIGRIDIIGNERTQDKAIRRVLDEFKFTPGELYDADMAPKEGGGKLEGYLQRMSLAQEAIIEPASPSDPADDRRDVRINIKEGDTGIWSPSVGVSSNRGLIGRLLFEQGNFDISDWPESFGEFLSLDCFTGAGQSLRVLLDTGTEYSRYSIMFNEPYFRDRPTSLNLVGSSYQTYWESHDEERLKGAIGFTQRLENRWRRTLGFRLEEVTVKDIHDDAPQEIYDVKGGSTLFGARLGLGRDMTDNRFTPSRGYIFDADYEQVTGDHNFGILSGSYVWYKTLWEDLLERKTVLATKLSAGTMVGDAPPFEKFYAGGTGLYGIRGFDYRGVSPRGLQTGVSEPRRKDPIGSDWVFLASAEVVVPLTDENFAALFFVDSGTVDSGSYRASVGTGIQILLPGLFGNAPMRFEVAAPFMKDDEDDTEAFSFSIGGSFGY